MSGFSESGVPTYRPMDEQRLIIGNNRLKETCKNNIFTASRISKENDPIVVSIVAPWGQGKSLTGHELFRELVMDEWDDEKRQLTTQEFGMGAIPTFLTYPNIDGLKRDLKPSHICYTALEWLHPNGWSELKKRGAGSAEALREHLNSKSNLDELDFSMLGWDRYDKKFSFALDDPFDALDEFLERNRLSRLVVIIDEIEKIHEKGAFSATTLSALIEKLAGFIDDATRGSSKWQVAFVFLISKQYYRELMTVGGPYIRRLMTSGLMMLDSKPDFAFAKDFVVSHTNSDENELINEHANLFKALWEATGRNYGWFEIACARLLGNEKIKSKLKSVESYEDILEEIYPDISKIGKPMLTPLYKTILNYFGRGGFEMHLDIIRAAMLTPIPLPISTIQKKFRIHDLDSAMREINKISVKYEELRCPLITTLGSITEEPTLTNSEFSRALSGGGIDRIEDSGKIRLSGGIEIPYDDVESIFYYEGDDNWLFYDEDDGKELALHIGWVSDIKVDANGARKFISALKNKDFVETKTHICLSPSARCLLYPNTYKSEIVPEWLNPDKLKEILEWLEES